MSTASTESTANDHIQTAAWYAKVVDDAVSENVGILGGKFYGGGNEELYPAIQLLASVSRMHAELARAKGAVDR